MKKPVRIGISGAYGRMGRKLLEVAYLCQSGVVGTDELKRARLSAALEYAGHPLLGAKTALLAGIAGIPLAAKEQVLLSDTFDPESVDVFIDFSTPAGAVALSKKCRQHNIAMVVGVTAFSEAEKKELQAASNDIPLLMSPNMSAGMMFMFNIVRQATSLFKDNGDVEICETHHNQKKDAPSGTALRLGEIVAEELGVSFDNAKVLDRQQQSKARVKKEIGFSSIRGGDIVGEHRVIFASQGEQIEIIHRTTDRITYAFGATLAAIRIAGEKPGLYSMEDFFKPPEKNS